MDALPPIPTPLGQRWREFRIQVLPVLVFILAVVAIALLWASYVQPSPVVGEVEAIRAEVTSLQDGLVHQLTVDRFEAVTNGQLLGEISTSDPSLQQATLAQVVADLNLIRARMDVDKTRNLDALTRLRIELLTEKANYAMAQPRLQQAQSEFERVKRLFEEKIAPPGVSITGEIGYEVAQRDRAVVRAEVEGLSNRIAQLEKDIVEMEQTGLVRPAATDPSVEEAIKAQQEVLRQTFKPALLRAPMDGVVNFIYRRAGEKVVRGEAILSIASPTSDRIIGYVREPLPPVPTTNDTVTVRARNSKRQIAQAPILRVGAQLERITNAVLLADPTRVQNGLPILVSLPRNMALLPGEVVDLSIQYTGTESGK
jgi:multidrug resistance efflux pump